FNFACAGLPAMPDYIEPAVVQRIHRAARAHALSIAAVSGTFNMIHPDPRQRREGLCRLRELAAVCAPLGTSVITLCTGTRDPDDLWRHHPDNARPEAWVDLIGAMSQAASIAEEFNLTLGIEPEVNNVVDSARQARRLLDEMKSPRLQIVIDPANLLRPGDLPRQRDIFDEAFDLLGQSFVLAHAKEL